MQTPLPISICAHIPTFFQLSQSSDPVPPTDEVAVAVATGKRTTTPRAAKTPLLVIEDHVSLVDAIRMELSKDYSITYVCAEDELLAALQEKNFTLAVVDLTLHQRLAGLDMMKTLKQAGMKFLVFSGTAEDWHILAAIRFGALGYVNKRKSLFHLRRALQTIAKGETEFPADILAKMRTRRMQKFPTLGPAETELINILMTKIDSETKGLPSNLFISIEMQVSLSRVEGLFRTLCNKFKTSKSSRILLYAELEALGYYPGVSLAPFGELLIKL